MSLDRFIHSGWMLFIAIGLYTIGVMVIPTENIDRLRSTGIAEQHEYTYIDSDGDEHESESLIHIEGLGDILTYKTVYLSPIVALIPFLIIGRWLYGENQDELKTMIFGVCVIGLALISLSSRNHIISTILFWLGIISASFCLKGNNH